jgi:hypothetical protein
MFEKFLKAKKFRSARLKAISSRSRKKTAQRSPRNVRTFAAPARLRIPRILVPPKDAGSF